jgi:hypothetical protein
MMPNLDAEPDVPEELESNRPAPPSELETACDAITAMVQLLDALCRAVSVL